MIEASVPTMILFCVKSAKMLMIYIYGKRFGPEPFVSGRFPVADNNITIIHDTYRVFINIS